MKKILIPLLVVAVLALGSSVLSGCASVQVANEGANVVTIENSGCFLFCCIPLFSGDPDYPNEEVCNWFENTVKVSTNIRLLEEEAFKQHARGYRNVASHMDDESILWFLLKRKVYRTSAELIKD